MSEGLNFLENWRDSELSPKAKHMQLTAALLAAIDAGYWQPGAKLPTEQELARQTPYSLGTVQRAMRTLVGTGIVVRRQGAGSYVAAREGLMDDPWHLRFHGDDGVSFLSVSPKVLFRDRFSGPGHWNEFLELDPSKEVVQVDRRIDIGGEFYVFSRFFAAVDPYAVLLYKPLSELDGANFRKSLRSEFGIVIATISQDVRTVVFPSEICDALSLSQETNGLFIQVVARATQGAPVYYQELYVPATDRRLHISDIKS